MIDLDSMSDDDKLAALESIHKSIAQSKDIQKQKIAANVDLVLQALKKMESDIRSRYDETGKAIEKRVASIKDGQDGRNGVDGKSGKDGRAGRDGSSGQRGVDGLNGSNGIDGEDGISISDAHIDFDGSLVITLSDGRELNVGEVVSQDIAEKIKVISTMSTNGAIAVKEEGTTLTNGVKSINFVGAGITATTSGDDVTVTVAGGGGSGTVTSVAATVPAFLSVAGSPITTSGTLAITLSGTALPVANGGTGATTAPNALTSLAAAGTGISNTFSANQIVSVTDNTNAALRITQLGTGNALLVEDSTNPDSTPVVINAAGQVIVGNATVENVPDLVGSSVTPSFSLAGVSTSTTTIGASYFANTSSGGATLSLTKSRGAIGVQTVVASADTLGAVQFSGSDGTVFIRAASIVAAVDGTPGTNDMPGRLVFSTTADGASSPTERMRIDSIGHVGIGGAANALTVFNVSKSITGGTSAWSNYVNGTVQSDVTTTATFYGTSASTAATAFTLSNLFHFSALQATFGASSAVTNQTGFNVSSNLTGATNNYGFYGNIASGTGRYNFYAAGTASNYFAGDMQLDKTVTAGGTTGAQTINKNAGTVNFAAAASSLVVTDSRVTTSSIIICTVGTNDTTLKSVAAVAAAGSFTLHANAAATAETRVNFLIIN